VSANGTLKSVFGESLASSQALSSQHSAFSLAAALADLKGDSGKPNSAALAIQVRNHQNTSVQVHQVHIRFYFH
jgi:hypothetical protein